MLKIRHLKLLDRHLGSTLAHLLPKPQSPLLQSDGELQSILLIRPGGIGDAVHLIPAIQALRKHFPRLAIDVLAERRNSHVFGLCPDIRQVCLYDRPVQLLRVLRNRYDIVIDTEQWHRLSAVVARLVRAPVKIGYATNERVRLFTHAIPYSHDDYEADSFHHLLAPVGIAAVSILPGKWLTVPETACHSAALSLAITDDRPLVVLFPGASIAERRWGGDRFRKVAQWCIEQRLHVVVVGGREDRDNAERIVAGLDALNLAGRTSLAETAAILDSASIVVSGDTGILHVAAGLDRPTVSLFGPGIAAKWAPRGHRHITLNKCLPCSPCTRFGYTPPCPYAGRCMSDITVNEVTRAIATHLKLSLDRI